MAGRKSNAKIIGPNAYLPIDIFAISHSMEWVREAKREIRDKDGKLLNSEKDFRIGIGGTYTKEQAESIRSDMQKQGIKNIKLHKLNLDFPSKCPSCKREGTPAITEDKRAELNEKKHRLNYNHSSGKKTCYVGTVNFSEITEIKLKRGLPLDILLHKRRTGVYSL